MDHHVVAQQADLGAALDVADADHTVSDLPNFRDVEDLLDERLTEVVFADVRRAFPTGSPLRHRRHCK